MVFKYLIIEESDRYIGSIEVQHPICVQDVVLIDGEHYHVKGKNQKTVATSLYVQRIPRIQEATLIAEESIDEVRSKPLGDVMKFLSHKSFDVVYSKAWVHITFDGGQLKFAAGGESLTEALHRLRNTLIKEKLLKRGEW